MLTQYNLKMPHEIYSGENAMKNLKDILLKNQVKKAAVFTDKGIQGAGPAGLPHGTDSGGRCGDDHPQRAAPRAHLQSGSDTGGRPLRLPAPTLLWPWAAGSVMDTAKLASILATDEYGVKDLLDDPSRGRNTSNP